MIGMLKDHYDYYEKAAYTACSLGITICADSESYGGTKSVRAMKGEDLIIHSKQDEVVMFLCRLFSKIQSILALLKAEKTDINDYDAVIESLSYTVCGNKNVDIYKYWIYKNDDLMRAIKK